MNIAIYVGGFGKHEGGGYTIQDSILRNIAKAETNHKIYICSYAESIIRYTKSTELIPVVMKRQTRSILKRVLFRTRKILFYEKIEKSVLSQVCIQSQIDLVYFTSYEFEKVDVPYIYTVWDLQHRLQPFFPEVSRNGIWESREHHLTNAIKKSSFLVVGTKRGASEVSQFYNVHPDRIRIIPFPAPDYIQGGIYESTLIEEKFLFYPAQLWPHKNHVILIEALSVLNKKGKRFKLICTGADKKGHLNYLSTLAKEMEVEDQIEFKGFVSQKELCELYKSALAMIFPTFFGPDNLPPLEAMSLGCPTLVSNVPGAKEQFADCTLFFDPLDPLDLVEKIERISEDEVLRKELVMKGEKLVKSLTIERYMNDIHAIFNEFAKYRARWK